MIFPIVGPSCAGKTTLLKGLREAIPHLSPLQSITTRTRRDSDEEGEYRYVSDAVFDTYTKDDAFLWTVQPFQGNSRYGTLKADIDVALLSPHPWVPILIDVLPKLVAYAKDMGHIDALHPIGLIIDDEEELRRRFIERGEQDELVFLARLSSARNELYAIKHFPFPIYRINAERSAQEVLLEAEHYIQSKLPPR